MPDRPGHDRRYAIDASLATERLGYRPQQTFESGLADTVDWFLANEGWWRAILNGSYRDWLTQNYAARAAN